MRLRLHIHDGVLSFHPISTDINKAYALYSWLDNLLPDELMHGDWTVDLNINTVWQGDDPPLLQPGVADHRQLLDEAEEAVIQYLTDFELTREEAFGIAHHLIASVLFNVGRVVQKAKENDA